MASHDHLAQRHRGGLVVLVQPLGESKVHQHVLVPREDEGVVGDVRQSAVQIVVAVARPAVEKRPDAAVDDGVPREHSLRAMGRDGVRAASEIVARDSVRAAPELDVSPAPSSRRNTTYTTCPVVCDTGRARRQSPSRRS